MLDDLKAILGRVQADYADLRYEVKRETRISFDGRELTQMTANTSDGYVLRVLDKGGMSTIAFTQPADAAAAIRTAQENARLIAGRIPQPVRLAPAPAVKDTYQPALDVDPRRVSIDEKLELVRHYNDIPLKAARVATTTTAYEEVTREKYFVNTEGTAIREDLATNRVVGAIVSQDGTLTQRMRVGCGGSSGFAVLRNRAAAIEKTTQLAVDLLQAQPIPAGAYRAVLSPHLAGVFTHEAFGHFSEADIIEDAPSMREKMRIGAKLGTDILSIKDEPTRLNQLGHYRYDDEGVASRPTQLMKNGVLSGRLHSRRTAASYGEPLSGHSIAEDYRFAPIIRMGCIFIEPGSETFDSLLTRLGNGVYLVDPMGGQTTGENFTFGAQYGYEVKDGRQGRMLRDINISGNLYKTLLAISAIAGDVKLGEIGGCGKGQLNIRSCYGAPHVIVDSVMIGGA
jgi:TldD protein